MTKLTSWKSISKFLPEKVSVLTEEVRPLKRKGKIPYSQRPPVPFIEYNKIKKDLEISRNTIEYWQRLYNNCYKEKQEVSANYLKWSRDQHKDFTYHFEKYNKWYDRWNEFFNRINKLENDYEDLLKKMDKPKVEEKIEEIRPIYKELKDLIQIVARDREELQLKYRDVAGGRPDEGQSLNIIATKGGVR